MRAQQAGRIVTVTSIGGLIGQPFNDAYCAAKFAAEGLMESLAPTARKLGIFVSLIEPGPINTDFVANAPRPDLAAVPELYRPLLTDFITQGERVYRTLGQSGDDVARVIVKAATRKSPALRYTTSRKANLLIRVLLAAKLLSLR
jgi:NAD(P)-dependent dehydrogenase (short-subunit alcohol dehydrogenase family)